MRKLTLTEVQEAQRVPYKINPRKNTPRFTLIKLKKIKNKENIKSNKGKATKSVQGNPHEIIHLLGIP